MGYLIEGVRRLSTKGLKRFIILPILFNLILFSALFYSVYHYLFPYAQIYINQLPAWLGFMSGVLFVVFILSCFLIFLSAFTVVFNLLAAPFNGFLAEKAQYIFYNEVIPSLSFSTIAIRSIKRQGHFILYFIPRFLCMCILFFIPFLHPVFPFIWFAFNAWILSVQYQDFAMDNNLVSFSEMKRKIAKNKAQTFGFGSLVHIISFIPLLNIFIMPAAVIGGVLMYCGERNRNLLIKHSDHL